MADTVSFDPLHNDVVAYSIGDNTFIGRVQAFFNSQSPMNVHVTKVTAAGEMIVGDIFPGGFPQPYIDLPHVPPAAPTVYRIRCLYLGVALPLTPQPPPQGAGPTAAMQYQAVSGDGGGVMIVLSDNPAGGGGPTVQEAHDLASKAYTVAKQARDIAVNAYLESKKP